MTPPDSNDDHLADLRRRWEEEPGSRLFLQLAEEYRRAGRNREALEVLEKGLESHPKQVSGLVSLGRIRLSLEQPAEAAEALEKAVEIDPTNPMAMKLATEAHLQAGDRAMAKQRLDLYKLLNAGDEDTESLEARVEGRRPEDSGEPEVGDAAASMDMPDEGGGAWSPTAAWPRLPQAGSPGADGDAPPVEPSEAADAVAGGYASEFGSSDTSPARDESTDDRPEPFADLLSDGSEGDYLSGLAAEGIFPVEEDDLRAEPAQDGSVPGEEREPPGDAGPDADSGDGPWDLVDADAVAAVERASDDGLRPTVTLGQLYLDQGHHAEALAIFEAVLERDPGRAAAAEGRRAALEAQGTAAGEVPAPPAPSAPVPPAGFTLQAGDLLGDADPSKPRKVALLEAYLHRIRGERAS